MRRRLIVPTLAMVAIAAAQLAAPAQEKAPADDELAQRYGLGTSPGYAQKTPQEAVQSFVRALDYKKFDYMLAHLADPKFVDARVGEYRDLSRAGSPQARAFLAFDKLVADIEAHYLADPQLLRELRAFAGDGLYEENGDQATGVAKAVPGRKVYLRRVGTRWFLENRQ